MTRRRIAAGVAGTLVAACAVLSAAGCAGGRPTTTTASHASTRIVIGQRIGPIYLLEPKAKIEAAYGKGQRVTLGSGGIVTFYRSVSIGVMYSGSPQRTWEIETASPRYRTSSGLGVGSGIAAVRKIGATCSRTFSTCDLGGLFGPPANPVTANVFYLNRKPFPTDRGVRVVRIDLSLAG